jgi:hypothetical protein
MTELTKAQLKLAGLEILDTLLNVVYRFCLSLIGLLIVLLGYQACEAFGILEPARPILQDIFVLIVIPNLIYQQYKSAMYGRNEWQGKRS